LTASDRTILEFLGDKRWFGEKGRTLTAAAVRELIPVTWPGAKQKYAVGRVDVATDEGTSVYQLFLVEGADEPRDALEEPEFRRLLADAFAKGAEFGPRETRWIIAREGKKALVVPANAPIALASGEQSNSSIVLNDEAILKLYRRLERGVHPDVEVTRFLTVTRAFPHVPVLLGTIRFEDAGGTTIAGMLQEFVIGAVDGWTYALDCSRAYFAADASAEVPFQAEANQLGIVTRAMHEVLASGDAGSEFELRMATPADVRRWTDGAVRTVQRALAALARSVDRKTLPHQQRKAAAELADQGERYVSSVAAIADEIRQDAGANTRTHGDYHLGQVIRSAADRFLIIDFEGEPARPLAERRARQSPLRDVAGMLRSFAYAAAEGAKQAKAGVADARASRWEESSRGSFLRGYFAEPPVREGRELLPASHENVARLLRLFETEKVFYELQYELDHRPDWVWIPLRGITKVFA
jgi:trehalose synthase-fused probable maltokinase